MSEDSDCGLVFKTGIDAERDKNTVKISVPNVENSPDFYYGTFPKDFKWGCATSAYQIEGGWDADGKGESDWDRYVHNNAGRIDDGSNADVAADSYNRFREDVQLLKNMGANMYRFSVSWPRILPTGDPNQVNEKGVEYYSNLIDELWRNGIEPIVTLFHWDIPQALAEKYTWENEELIEKFVQYCRIIFQRLGHKIKYYVTINEPWAIAAGGHDLGIFPPFKARSGSFYAAFHNLIKAHAAVYRAYEKEFKDAQHGKLGLSLDSWWMEPADPNSPEDVEAAKRGIEFKLGCGAYPLIHGCYPPSMRERIDRNSKDEGKSESRLPEFDEEWTVRIKGAYDFFGLNHYTSELVTTPSRAPKDIQEVRWSVGNPGFDTDQDIFQYYDPAWPSTPSWWCKFVPWGFRKLLKYIKDEYDNPEILVTENGCSGTRDEFHDIDRINYFRGYINDMLKAVNVDGCKVIGYSAWSLIDGWEWSAGHTVTFGLHHVDLDDSLKKRTPRESAKFLETVFKQNGFTKN